MRTFLKYSIFTILSLGIGLSYAGSHNLNTANPFEQFQAWQAKAQASGAVSLHKAVLATVDQNGLPQARYMYVPGFTKDGFLFAFKPNSRLGIALKNNPHAMFLYLWKIGDHSYLQVHIIGTVSPHGNTLAKNGEQHPSFKTYILKPTYFQFGKFQGKDLTVEHEIDHFNFKEGKWQKVQDAKGEYVKVKKMPSK